MLQKFIAPGLVLTILLGSACTIKGSGSQREKYESKSADAQADGGADAAGDPEGGEETPTCLALAAKKKAKALNLQDEEESTDEEVVDDGSTDEEVVDDGCAPVDGEEDTGEDTSGEDEEVVEE